MSKRQRKMVRFVVKAELIEHFFYGVVQGLYALVFLSTVAFGQVSARPQQTKPLYQFTLPIELVKQPDGRNTKKAEVLYDAIWEKPLVVKSLHEVGSMSESGFVVEFSANVSDSEGIAFVNSLCVKHFGVQATVSLEKFKKTARLVFGVLLQKEGEKEVLEVQFDVSFPLFRKGQLTEFGGDLMEAIEADDEVELYREPTETLPHSFVVRMPQNKFGEIKDLVIDHLKKSGYEVNLDQ